ncbi:MAG: T9SS type A sorting domain-containing protein [Bacteroidales bacterium]|nr:T9SS type A sorting domain-containing protein [Bacteroidales bacterium]
MRKLSLLFMAMVVAFALQAQWTDNPATNNRISNFENLTVPGGFLIMTDAVTNDTYVKWNSLGGSNGMAPTLQRLTADGTPQWGENGIRFNQFDFHTSTAGTSMAITPDHDVLSCFSTADTVTVALRLHPDGTYAWGEQGVTLFDGNGGYRAEIIASNESGAWALGSDNVNLYLQYVNADGTLNPLITIEPDNDTTQCMFGKLVLRDDNSVFLTYEHVYVYQDGTSMSSIVDIHLTGYAKDGTQTVSDVKLMGKMNNTGTYCQEVEPDGLGGAYVYINQGDMSLDQPFNVRVFHYDADGNSTISDTLGVTVHSTDLAHVYVDPSVSVDPVSHDLLVTYVQESSSQYEYKVFVNRITATGERVWDEGVMVFYNDGNPISKPFIAAFEDGSGFAVTYFKGVDILDPNTTIEAIGMDMNCNVLWQTVLSSSLYMREYPDSISGFHNGQCIIVWANDEDNGNVYAQNFGVDGSMGQGLDVEEIFEDEEIITIVKIFNVNGQVMQCNDLNELNTGVYIIQGTTESGKMVNKKIVVVKE